MRNRFGAKSIGQVIFILLWAQISGAQTGRHLLTDNKLKTALDSAIDGAARIYMQDSNANGISIGVYRNGKKYTFNYCAAKNETSRIPSANDFYNIGSVAKTFVTTILAQAVIDKKIRLTDDIRKYLPGQYPGLEYQGRPVHVVELANHTSGLPTAIRIFPPSMHDSLGKLSMAEQVNFYSRYNEDSLLADLHHIKPDTIPGAEYRYNSNGMMILILLLERIYHQHYQQLVTHYLSTHLGMHDTKPELSATEIKRVVQGFDNKSQPQQFFNLKGFFIGPTMNSTINNMLKYIAANLSEEDKAIKLTHQLTWGRQDGFGLGLEWMMDDDSKGKRYIYHDGNTKIGYNTLCILYPGDHLGFIIIVNDTIGQDKIRELENHIKNELDSK